MQSLCCWWATQSVANSAVQCLLWKGRWSPQSICGNRDYKVQSIFRFSRRIISVQLCKNLWNVSCAWPCEDCITPEGGHREEFIGKSGLTFCFSYMGSSSGGYRQEVHWWKKWSAAWMKVWARQRYKQWGLWKRKCDYGSIGILFSSPISLENLVKFYSLLK